METFINFITTTALLKFVQLWNCRLFPRNILRRHQKPCAVSFATVQRYRCLVAKLRNSSTRNEASNRRPQLSWTVNTISTDEMICQLGADDQAKKKGSQRTHKPRIW